MISAQLGCGVRIWLVRMYLTAVVLTSLITVALAGEVRTATDFAELTSVCRHIDPFVVGSTILVERHDSGLAYSWPRSSVPFLGDLSILAYEENDHFVYTCGDASSMIRVSPKTGGGLAEPASVRRFIHLKPDIYVVDDFFQPVEPGTSVEWLIGCRSKPQITGPRLALSDGDGELVCETLWPAGKRVQQAAWAGHTNQSIFSYCLNQKATASGARFLHVLHLRKSSNGQTPVKSIVEDENGRLELAISSPEKVFHLTLPPPGAGAGWITIQDAGGKMLVPRRPLTSGILPHGPEGVRLLDRWDKAYRDGRRAPWDTGKPAPELKRVVEAGIVKPCRTIVLGCGSGTNAVYLADQGFEVTAVDVAPTALSIAAEKASETGVDVRWVLADVLALPDLQPFDFVFDRGCYHNVRYVDATGFVESLRRLSRPGTRCLVLSLDRDGPPGVREKQMRDDFTTLYEFEWLQDSGVEDRDGKVRRESWSLMLRRKVDK